MTTITRAQLEASTAVTRITDAGAECVRRWPDFAFSVGIVTASDGRRVCEVKALWTRKGQPHGLRDHLPANAGKAAIAASKEHIAQQALFNDELRRRTA